MKFIRIAFFLGCAALLTQVAVQFDPVHSQQSSLALRDFRALLNRLRLLPESAPAGGAGGALKARPEIPAVSKAEALRLIAGAAAKYHVPIAFVASIVTAESNFDCAAISPKGAIGLMQLMPDTAEEFGADPAVPSQNIDAGTHYLRWLMDRYRKKGNAMKRVIAAYNAGPGVVDRYRGVPPFRETRTYVARVLALLKRFGNPQRNVRVAG